MDKEELAGILRYISISEKENCYYVRHTLYDEDCVAYIKAFCDFTGHHMDDQDIISCVDYIKGHTMPD